MTIEKRHQARNKIELNAQLVYRTRTFSIIIKNISDGGIFLETNSLQIPQGTLVDLEFYYGGNEWQVSSHIVHKNNHGFGAMFTMHKPEISSSNNFSFQKGTALPTLIELPVQG